VITLDGKRSMGERALLPHWLVRGALVGPLFEAVIDIGMHALARVDLAPMHASVQQRSTQRKPAMQTSQPSDFMQTRVPVHGKEKTNLNDTNARPTKPTPLPMRTTRSNRAISRLDFWPGTCGGLPSTMRNTMHAGLKWGNKGSSSACRPCIKQVACDLLHLPTMRRPPLL
jgi:hypothetical protein